MAKGKGLSQKVRLPLSYNEIIIASKVLAAKHYIDNVGFEGSSPSEDCDMSIRILNESNYVQCSVCGSKVDANKNMIAEHKDNKGNLCYGSFMPVQNFDPFRVRRSSPQLGQLGQFQPSYEFGPIFGVPIEEVPPEL